jgi:hypothetical protein
MIRFNLMFSEDGVFVGGSVDDVAAALRSDATKSSEVPIDFIVRDDNTLILNTCRLLLVALSLLPIG